MNYGIENNNFNFLKNITMSDLKLTISEYGKEVRAYSDNDKKRFLEKVRQMIDDHLVNHSHQTGTEVKNITFQIFTIN